MFIPTLDAKIVGKVIADYRQKSGISQEVLSDLADIGRSYLNAIERGERKLILETFYRICTALNITMSKVITEIEKEIENQPR